MIFVDDLKWAVGVMFHPDKNSKETMDSIGAFIRYYKASLIPLLVAVIIEILLSSILAAAIASGLTSIFHLLLLPLIKISPYYGNLMSIAIAEIIGALALALLIVGTIFFVWIAVPVYLFITSMIYFIIGRWVLRIFKNEYDNTASAFVYSAAPLAVFAWVIAIPLVGPFVRLAVRYTNICLSQPRGHFKENCGHIRIRDKHNNLGAGLPGRDMSSAVPHLVFSKVYINFSGCILFYFAWVQRLGGFK
jgi:hypothetical protein